MAERAHPEDIGFKDKYFGLKKNPYRKKLYERYMFCNKFIKGKEVCDIPCGTGWGTSLLKKISNVVGVDISKESIDYAIKHFKKKNKIFLEGNMASIPLENNSIDTMLCLEGFEHVSKDVASSFIVESKRVLKEGGLLILTCPVLNENGQRTDNPYHIHEYDEVELIDLFNRNFRIISIERIKGPDSPFYRLVVKNIKDTRYKKLEF